MIQIDYLIMTRVFEQVILNSEFKDFITLLFILGMRRDLIKEISLKTQFSASSLNIMSIRATNINLLRTQPFWVYPHPPPWVYRCQSLYYYGKAFLPFYPCHPVIPHHPALKRSKHLDICLIITLYM